MGDHALWKRRSYNIILPNDVLRIIFADLSFMDKINSGLVCKQWDQVLRGGTPDARHWVVDFNVDRAVRNTAPTTEDTNSLLQQPSGTIVRYVILTFRHCSSAAK
jgi:hypothetical protein